MGDDGAPDPSEFVYDPGAYAAQSQIWASAPAGSNFTTPEDWFNWGKTQPGFFGTYVDPSTGQTMNTPPPPRMVGGGFSQGFNPKSGQWEITGTPNGGFFGFVEDNPYAFAALAAAGVIGAGVAGGAAGAVAEGSAATAGTDVGTITAAEAGGELSSAAGATGEIGTGSLEIGGGTGVAGGGGAAAGAGGGGAGLSAAQWAKLGITGVGLIGGAAAGKPGTPSTGAPGEKQTPGVLSSADILAQGRNLALAGVPLAANGALESVNALRAKAVGSSAEILPSIIENLGQLRSQYSGASSAISRKLGYAGGGQTVREKQKLLGGATKQYAGMIQGAQQQGVAGLNQVESGFAPLVSGVARAPSTSTSTSPFDNAGFGAQIGSLLGQAPALGNSVSSLFGGSNTASASQAAGAIQGFRNSGFNAGVADTGEATATTIPFEDF